MTWLANVLWLVGSLPLLAMILTARPTRGENLTGIHLVTGPAALPPAIAAALHLALAADTLGSFAWFAWLALPGYWVALLALPVLAMGPRHALPWKVAGIAALLAPGTLGNPLEAARWLPWLGLLSVVLLGGGTYCTIGFTRLKWMWARAQIAGAEAARLDQWQQGQAEFQRGEWQRLPADPSVRQLLSFVRAFAPEVKAESLARLAVHPELDAELRKCVAAGDDSDPLHYVVHHYPRSRRGLAGAMTEFLAREHEHWAPELAKNTGVVWIGNVMPALDAAVAVLQDGGDVRAPLDRWARTLSAHREYRSVGRQLAKYLR